MAAHHLTIAKASFAAACLRPDGPKISREELTSFHNLIGITLAQCTPTNVESCKNWILDHLASTTGRVNAWAKYMTSLSKYAAEDNGAADLGADLTSPRRRRKRLHVLYLINDTLHHAKYHVNDVGLLLRLTQGIQTYLPELLHDICVEGKRRVNERLRSLLDMWSHAQYFAAPFLTELRSIVDRGAASLKVAAAIGHIDPAKDVPFTLPATHGDPSIPYYDLPAANLMPHIAPNSGLPIRPDQIRALQLTAGPADKALASAVTDFLKDVRRLDDPFQSLEDEGIVADMDELGNLSYRNETDEILGDTYYGWSKEFCEKMKARTQKSSDGPHRGRSRSYSKSLSTSRSRSRSRNRSRSRGRYRSRSPRRRNRSREYSRTPRQFRSRSLSSQDDRMPPVHFLKSNQYQNAGNVPLPPQSGHPGIPTPPFTLIPQDVPLPVPRPPSWNGPWPPPPPHPGAFAGLVLPPPPPF